MADQLTAILGSIDIFMGMSPAEAQTLVRTAVQRTYATGEYLFHEGEPCAGLWIITHGTVQVLKTTPSGRQVMLAMQGSPSTIAEVPVFDGGPYPATVLAANETSAALILKSDFIALCRRNPDVTLKFLAIFGARLRHLVTLVERITFGNVRQRLAQMFVDFADQSGSPQFTIPDTHEEIANKLGTVREVVSRNLGRFQSEGLLKVQRREVEILNREGLIAEAQTEL